jgi:hypothetical protein
MALRVHCDGCGQDDVVAFSCKGRGFCPSCGAVLTVDTAAWLCDAVIPEVPVRQWVLSLPYRVRTLCVYDAAACAVVRSVLVRAVSGFYERTAARVGVPRPRAGAVSFVQRFDSGLRLNVHLHVLWLDGVYGWEPGRGQPVFHALQEPIDADVQQLVQRIRDRVLRALRKAGKWVDADPRRMATMALATSCCLASPPRRSSDRAAPGDRAGQRDGRVGRDGRWEPQRKGPLCATLDGFSLHAGTWVSAQARDRLEHLCRYALPRASSMPRLAAPRQRSALRTKPGPMNRAARRKGSAAARLLESGTTLHNAEVPLPTRGHHAPVSSIHLPPLPDHSRAAAGRVRRRQAP